MRRPIARSGRGHNAPSGSTLKNWGGWGGSFCRFHHHTTIPNTGAKARKRCVILPPKSAIRNRRSKRSKRRTNSTVTRIGRRNDLNWPERSRPNQSSYAVPAHSSMPSQGVSQRHCHAYLALHSKIAFGVSCQILANLIFCRPECDPAN